MTRVAARDLSHSARLGTHWRVLHRIDESKRVVVVLDIQHRSAAYRRR
jgi:mRNA-degrading endonuclease RelE of RelBE toxin-antitoxin system